MPTGDFPPYRNYGVCPNMTRGYGSCYCTGACQRFEPFDLVSSPPLIITVPSSATEVEATSIDLSIQILGAIKELTKEI